jgi:ABC-type branched-subunit amino acid transport system permease subunit
MSSDSTSSVVTVVVALIGALGTVGGAYVGANAVRRQTTPAKGRHRREAASHPDRAELSPEVEGYIVRFFIFSLIAALWGALLNVVLPLVTVRGRLEALAIGIVYSAIFLALGLPLLIDIYRRYSIRGLPRLRHRR